MIERFNFYDVYGYFIPGTLLIGVLWFPHALADAKVPTDLAAAVLGVIAAYVAGHVLQIVATKVLSSWVRAGNDYRAPSDLLLDPGPKFSKDFREKLTAAIKERFGLDVADQKKRSEAFFLCRNSIIASKTSSSYVEQFEGMYVLMRGICAAAAAGFAYDIGWLSGLFLAERRWEVAIVLMALGLVIGTQYRLELKAKDRKARIALGAALLLAVACSGALAWHGAARNTGTLLAAAAVSLLVSVWTFGAYHDFTWTWAQNVYQHFYLSEPEPQKRSTDNRDEERFAGNLPVRHIERTTREEPASCLDVLCGR